MIFWELVKSFETPAYCIVGMFVRITRIFDLVKKSKYIMYLRLNNPTKINFYFYLADKEDVVPAYELPLCYAYRILTTTHL